MLLAAHRRGCRLDAWSEHLRLEPWRQAFADAGLDPAIYHRTRELEELLPWDHLDPGVSRNFLLEERQRAYRTLETPDCRTEGCQGCGFCDQEQVDLRLTETPLQVLNQSPTRTSPEGRIFWYRLFFAKLEESRWLSHLELVNAIYRSLRRSGLPLAFSAGHHPLPRVAFHGALPVGVESLCESMDVGLAAEVEACPLVTSLNQVFPPGIRILSAQQRSPSPKPPRLEQLVYHVESPEPVFTEPVAAGFLESRECLTTRHRPKGTRTVDVRPLVAALEVLDEHELHLRLHNPEKDNLKVTEILRAIFALTEPQTQDLQILKVKVI